MKNFKNLKTFRKFNEELGTTTLGNVSGMGAVTSPQPAATPGDTQNAQKGSGDIGSGWGKAKDLNKQFGELTTTNKKKSSKKDNSKKTTKTSKNKEQHLANLIGPVKEVPGINRFEDFK